MFSKKETEKKKQLYSNKVQIPDGDDPTHELDSQTALDVCFHVKGSPDITGDLGHLRAAAMHRTALRQRVQTGKR